LAPLVFTRLAHLSGVSFFADIYFLMAEIYSQLIFRFPVTISHLTFEVNVTKNVTILGNNGTQWHTTEQNGIFGKLLKNCKLFKKWYSIGNSDIEFNSCRLRKTVIFIYL
jgi:hypothetical protein